jgi:hypothetical protein
MSETSLMKKNRKLNLKSLIKLSVIKEKTNDFYII